MNNTTEEMKVQTAAFAAKYEKEAKMKQYAQLENLLKKAPGDKLKTLYQMVKNDNISFEDFSYLVNWINKYNKEQESLDSWD